MKLLREPLVHFILLGALLFVVFAAAGKWSAPDPTHVVTVTPGMLENLKVSFQRAEGHPPDAAAMQSLIDGFVREEVLCREARALGLDRDDTLIRTILVKKMEYLAEGESAAVEPTEAMLTSYYALHRADFADATGHAPPLPEIHDAVATAWRIAARHAAATQAYANLRSHYRVVLPAGTTAAAANP